MNFIATKLKGYMTVPRAIPSCEHVGYISQNPKPYLYWTIIGAWIILLLWFQPRLWALTDMAYDLPSLLTLLLFIIFIDFAWLYGMYNIGVIIFALIHRYFYYKPEVAISLQPQTKHPAVAILYTTCNDFVEASAKSCVLQDYASYHVYILDDSSDATEQEKIDLFAARYPDIITVVRRPDRKAFKAGNLNHGLTHFAHEKYFAIADADEILPSDFLKKLVPVIESDDKCGFVQANHRVNPHTETQLSKSLGVGIDIHWKYYQPLRNDFGFVMFLGHGALLRRRCWEEIGGFPDIVSEDLGFAIEARELGYRGRFVSNVVCFEDFPDSVRSFRVRHMKWTRGTSEFLAKKFKWLIKAKNITWTEKLDILFPTLNLPLTLVYFLFMVVANLMLPFYFGLQQDLTLEIYNQSFVLPIYVLDSGFQSIYTIDFFMITLLTFFAPVLCFIIALIHRPLKMIKFISHSTAMYAALGPLSSIGVLSYLISGKAIFLVTGDKKDRSHHLRTHTKNILENIKLQWHRLLNRSHPDSSTVQGLEIFVGVVFAMASLYMFQISFLGLCLAFVFMPLLHRIGWDHKLIRVLAHLPYLLVMIGVAMAGLSLIGMQTMFFGFGFHF